MEQLLFWQRAKPYTKGVACEALGPRRCTREVLGTWLGELAGLTRVRVQKAIMYVSLERIEHPSGGRGMTHMVCVWFSQSSKTLPPKGMYNIT